MIDMVFESNIYYYYNYCIDNYNLNKNIKKNYIIIFLIIRIANQVFN